MYLYFVYNQLIAGSGSTEEADDNLGGDDQAKSAGDEAPAAGDGYTSGVPGPITRLFIIANRGISNLLQDLILVRNIEYLQTEKFKKIDNNSRKAPPDIKIPKDINRNKHYLYVLNQQQQILLNIKHLFLLCTVYKIIHFTFNPPQPI